MPGQQLRSNTVSNESSKVRYVNIDENTAHQRLDNYLIRILKNVPKSKIYKIIRRGEVRVNGRRAETSYKLQPEDVLRIPPVHMEEVASPSPTKAVMQLIERSILFEDRDLLVINKPSGVAVHGGSGVNYGVIEALRALRPQETRMELAHRLDRGTSGVLLIAKRPAALRAVHEQLREAEAHKTYLALVVGKWKGGVREVAVPLKKNVLASGERVVRVDPAGKASITVFEPIEKFDGYALLEASPVTGRTHQIRVHAAHLGHALAGDDKYGDDRQNKILKDIGLNRLFLHAKRLSIDAPGDSRALNFEAPLGEDLERVLVALRGRR
jgi:23S rRNA pseudouridine955/2504/2580 synthase